jgi:hypothetical protein
VVPVVLVCSIVYHYGCWFDRGVVNVILVILFYNYCLMFDRREGHDVVVIFSTIMFKV